MKNKTAPDKTKDEQKKFSNPLIKQGNSYCIRVPSNIVKDMSAKEGDMLGVKILKLDLRPKTEHLHVLFDKMRPLKELKKYSDEKLLAILAMVMRQGKLHLESSEYKLLISDNQLSDERKKQLSEKINQDLYKYYAKIEKDFGKQFLEEYKYISEIIGKNISK